MTTYYVDTSALVKRYVDEVGCGWLRAALNIQPRPVILVVHLVIVELTSALARRRREGALASVEYTLVQNAFRADCINDYELITAIGPLIDHATHLLERHALRAYDAIHLGAALSANERLVINNLPPLTFLSADQRLNDVALKEGLTVDNPNHHP